MTYLLDTHAFIWYLRSPAVLPPKVRRLIEDDKSVLAISLATPWEMSIKAGTGKLDVQDILDEFEPILDRGHINLLTPTVGQAVRSGQMPHFHRDPFDRLLAAQSLELGWSLISRDTIFDAYGVRRIWN